MTKVNAGAYVTQHMLNEAANGELRNRGCHLFFQQLQAMLNKKLLYTLRNWLLFSSQLLIPVFFLATCLVVVQTLPGDSPIAFSILKCCESIMTQRYPSELTLMDCYL